MWEEWYGCDVWVMVCCLIGFFGWLLGYETEAASPLFCHNFSFFGFGFYISYK